MRAEGDGPDHGAGRGETVGGILVVDDDEDTLLFLQEALGILGREVTGAVSAFEALDFLSERQVDLIVLDLHMPGMSGLDLLGRIRDTDRDVPIIVCSAYPGLRNDFAIWNSGVAAFLAKPIAPDVLAREAAAALSGRRTEPEGTS